MYNARHSKFILTPISSIIEDAGRACASLGSGIEVHPLGSYVMQTTFLRMTGASEQKLKCINWEIASVDYEYRYKMLQNPPGEMSSYDDKKKICKALYEVIIRLDSDSNLSDTEKDIIIKMASVDLDKIISNSFLTHWFEKEYKEYVSDSHKYKRTSFYNMQNGSNGPTLLDNIEQKVYMDYVWRQRNRYAHNLTSYQQNIPTLTHLANKEISSGNHFRMFSLLILLDGVFMTLFRKFEKAKNQHIY